MCGATRLRPALWWGAGLAALICAFLATSVAAQNSAPERLATLGAARPWQAVGRIDIRGKGFCTGTLIAPDLVLTAAHCVVVDGVALSPDDMMFRAGLRDGRTHAERFVRRIIVAPERFAAPAPSNDLALLEITRPVRRAGFNPAETGAPLIADQRVGVVSYAAGRADAPSRQASCDTLDADAHLAILSCETNFGASGAPVFNADGKVVGLVLAMGTVDAAPVTVAHRLGPLFDTLLQMNAGGEGIWGANGQGAFLGLAPGERRDTGARTVRPPQRGTN